MIKMREEILTLEEVFREESIAVQELIDEKKIELTAYDMREVGYTDLQNDIVMLETVLKYFQRRLLGDFV
jgi:hypothetical protein